jgi:hypothetical protein
MPVRRVGGMSPKRTRIVPITVPSGTTGEYKSQLPYQKFVPRL